MFAVPFYYQQVLFLLMRFDVKKIVDWLKKLVFVSATVSTNTKTAAKLIAAKEFLEKLESDRDASNKSS